MRHSCMHMRIRLLEVAAGGRRRMESVHDGEKERKARKCSPQMLTQDFLEIHRASIFKMAFVRSVFELFCVVGCAI